MAQSSSSSKFFKVFVYGTLKRGQPNYHWLSLPENGYSKFISEGQTTRKFPLVIGTRYNIPFLLDKPDHGHFVRGEIYEIDDKMLNKLDILEDYPRYYDREIQDIRTNEGLVPCWVYLIRKFPESMLSKPFLESYKEPKELPYCEKLEREQEVKAIDDMDY